MNIVVATHNEGKLVEIRDILAEEFGDGAHLHLEVAKDGKSVDPMPYVKGEIFREVEQKQ